MNVLNGISQAGLQSSASTVASSLSPKKHVATANALSGAVAQAGTAKAVNARTAPATGTGGTGSTATTSSSKAAAAGTITGNDFLTLLVTELKHQDPTQPTDPNAYITQLVGVNSLQQLISINQGIGTLDTTASKATTQATGKI